MIERRLRTIRSFGGAFVFLTQGPGELKASDIGTVLVEQYPTQICLPVDRATKEDYITVLKRSEGEWDAFTHLRKGEGRFLVCQGPQSVVAELPLHGMDDMIAVLVGQPGVSQRAGRRTRGDGPQERRDVSCHAGRGPSAATGDDRKSHERDSVMKASLVLTASAVWALTSAAHAESRTVSWYQAHPAERVAMMHACLDDPGHIGRSPDCVSAEVAGNRSASLPTPAPIPCDQQSRNWQIISGCGPYARGAKP